MISILVKSFRSFKYAFLGIYWFIKSENNTKIHAVCTVGVIGISLYFQISKNEALWILLSVSLVWVTEILNTAIEKLVDLVSPEFDQTAGKVKDLAAAAVLVAAVFALIIGLVTFIPYIKNSIL